MIGWINNSVESFIRDSFGDEAWLAVVAKARCRVQVWLLRAGRRAPCCPRQARVHHPCVLSRPALGRSRRRLGRTAHSLTLSPLQVHHDTRASAPWLSACPYPDAVTYECVSRFPGWLTRVADSPVSVLVGAAW